MERGQDRSIEFSVITSVGLEKGFHANSCQIGNDEDGGSERRGTGRTIELGLRDSETTIRIESVRVHIKMQRPKGRGRWIDTEKNPSIEVSVKRKYDRFVYVRLEYIIVKESYAACCTHFHFSDAFSTGQPTLSCRVTSRYDLVVEMKKRRDRREGGLGDKRRFINISSKEVMENMVNDRNRFDEILSINISTSRESIYEYCVRSEPTSKSRCEIEVRSTYEILQISNQLINRLNIFITIKEDIKHRTNISVTSNQLN
ncbi:hypothetical protein V1477_016546 [Vespula maculifrons]|uniref:Uncharacterized protein n=1 Tax=Vespula maculifrons TaxID=7453 RepID=A0ABD2B9G4_VESMC